MESTKCYGLFVGVNRYESEDIRPLAFASADVLAVRAKLAERCGLVYEDTVVLADDVEDGLVPTRRQILRAMNRFAGAPMGEGDTFLLVFAGHGFVTAGKTYLASSDSEIASEALLRETAISLESIGAFMAQIPAGQHVLILDACRDAPVKGTRSAGSGAMSGEMTRDIGTVMKAATSVSPEGTHAKAVLCSCWEGQVAHEYAQGGHGWFCYNFLAELDAAPSRELSLAELHGRIKNRMRETAWRLLPAAKDQFPHLLIEGDVPVLRSAASPTVIEPDIPTVQIPEVAEIHQYCAVCGASLKEDSFRCTRCGSICCSQCKDDRWRMCSKCARNIELRGKLRASGDQAYSPAARQPQFIRIPTGEFLMGRKRVIRTLPAFRILPKLVSCGEYAQFLEATSYDPEGRVKALLSERPDDHPVGAVTYQDALAYATWLKCELPTEEQWEKAARGKDGRPYPWGDVFDPTKCNVADSNRGKTVAVASIAAGCSPYGCYHMTGNVWEWTASWCDASRRERIVKGGSYLEDAKTCTCHYREGLDPQFSKPDLGFRCTKL